MKTIMISFDDADMAELKLIKNKYKITWRKLILEAVRLADKER
jgi:hypothetical protein